MTSTTRWKTGFPGWRITAILALAFIVRVLAIQSRGLQYDDVFSIFLSQRSLPEIIKGTAADTMPPLYYFLLHFWINFSQQVGFIRLLSVIFSVLAVFLVFLVCRRLFGSPDAEWSAFIMAISPFQYYHAQDVRNYALLLCCQLGYVFCWVIIWQAEEQKQKTRWEAWIGLVVCGALAMYTHNAAVFGLLVPNVFLLILRRWKQLGGLLAGQAAIVVLALPWLLLVPGQIAKVQHAWWQPPPGILELLQVPLVWTAGLPLPGVWLIVGLFISMETLALLIVGLIKAGRANQGILILLAFTLVLPIAIFAASYLVKPIFVPRAFILASAAYCGLAGWVIAQFWRAGMGKMLAAGFIMAAMIGIPSQITFAGFPRSPFEQASAALAQNIAPGSLVVHDNKLSYFPFRFYQTGLNQRFIADAPGSGNDTFATASQEAMQIFPDDELAQAVNSSPTVYFVVFTRTIQEYRDLGESGHPSIGWLQAHFIETDHWNYNDLEVYKFEKP